MKPHHPTKKLSRKAAVLIVCIVLAILTGSLVVRQWFDRSYETEMAHIYRAVYSSARVDQEIGRIKDVSIMYAAGPHGRDKAPKDWNRSRTGNSVDGTVRLLLVGDKGSGEFLLSYRYDTKNDQFSVKDLVETKILADFTRLNQALSPTTTSAAGTPVKSATGVAQP